MIEIPGGNQSAGSMSGSDQVGASVNFDSVQKSYDGKTLVVRDLNLDIEPGEFVTMLGPSGSGKTTVLMMLAGFEPVTHGEIRLDGSPINALPPEKRGIGMVFQNYALFPHMTVEENLAYPLKVRRMSKDDIAARVRHALEMVELPEFGSRRPGQPKRPTVRSNAANASASRLSDARHCNRCVRPCSAPRDCSTNCNVNATPCRISWATRQCTKRPRRTGCRPCCSTRAASTPAWPLQKSSGSSPRSRSKGLKKTPEARRGRWTTGAAARNKSIGSRRTRQSSIDPR